MKKLSLLLLLAAFTLPVTAQELSVIKYLDKNGDSTGKENAFSYNVVTYTDASKTAYTTRNYTLEGHLNSEISYRDSGKTWLYDGSYITYHKNGKPKVKGSYVRNKLNGELTTWYDNGQVKRKDEYVLDSLISGHCYKANGQDTTWFPYHIGFNYGKSLRELYTFIGRNIKYPKEAKRMGIEGTVHIQFVIEKDGSLSNEKIRRSVSDVIDKEALRVLRAVPGLWQPALTDGEPQRTYAILPIMFKLEG
ncbi:energy transducer TonB [Longitalea luteola]|uniref:energy transducer TonB n=1 Tax=Longitalea luteola TaxID=2812563 RepID=UPI001A95CB20|nr:energy transducer TonB [Longitalea luteola]